MQPLLQVAALRLAPQPPSVFKSRWHADMREAGRWTCRHAQCQHGHSTSKPKYKEQDKQTDITQAPRNRQATGCLISDASRSDERETGAVSHFTRIKTPVGSAHHPNSHTKGPRSITRPSPGGAARLPPPWQLAGTRAAIPPYRGPKVYTAESPARIFATKTWSPCRCTTGVMST